MVQADGVTIGLSCPCGTKKWANIVDGTSYETRQNELCWNTRAFLTSVRVTFSVAASVLRLRLRNRSGLEQRQQCLRLEFGCYQVRFLVGVGCSEGDVRDFTHAKIYFFFKYFRTAS